MLSTEDWIERTLESAQWWEERNEINDMTLTCTISRYEPIMHDEKVGTRAMEPAQLGSAWAQGDPHEGRESYYTKCDLPKDYYDYYLGSKKRKPASKRSRFLGDGREAIPCRSCAREWVREVVSGPKPHYCPVCDPNMKVS